MFLAKNYNAYKELVQENLKKVEAKKLKLIK